MGFFDGKGKETLFCQRISMDTKSDGWTVRPRPFVIYDSILISLWTTSTSLPRLLYARSPRTTVLLSSSSTSSEMAYDIHTVTLTT